MLDFNNPDVVDAAIEAVEDATYTYVRFVCLSLIAMAVIVAYTL